MDRNQAFEWVKKELTSDKLGLSFEEFFNIALSGMVTISDQLGL